MKRASRGFTLIELMVALFIAAIIFAMGYGAIRQALTSHESLKEQQARIINLQTAVRVLEQDFLQLTPRPVRQPVGDEPAQAALVGSPPGGDPIVALTRLGWANPGGLQRTGLQRVAYFLQKGTLRREHFDVLDPVLASKTEKRNLLEHVKSFTLRYLDQNRTWQPQWPPATNTVMAGASVELSLRQRPLAVEITIESEEWGKIVRIIEIAG